MKAVLDFVKIFGIRHVGILGAVNAPAPSGTSIWLLCSAVFVAARGITPAEAAPCDRVGR